MKRVGAEEYDCFGCVGDKCKDEDLNIWDYIGQDVAAEKRYTCAETTEGCRLITE